MSQTLATLIVELDAKTEGLNSKFKTSAESVRAFEKATKEATRVQDALNGKFGEGAKSASTYGSGIRGIATEMNSTLSIIQRVSAAIGSVYNLAEEGARNATAEQFFKGAGKSLEEYRQATRGLVGDAELMKKANLADTMGISGDAFKNLALVAQASAAKTGQSYTHMLDSIILGTARESRLLLDNLGIIVNVTKAREDYVQKLREQGRLGDQVHETNKKLATSLTDAAEKEAFLSAAMAAGEPVLKQYAEAGDKVSESFDRVSAKWANAKDTLGRALGEAFQPGIKAVTELLEGLAKLSGNDLAAVVLSGGLRFLPGTGQLQPDQKKADDAIDPLMDKKETELSMLSELNKRGVSLASAMSSLPTSFSGWDADTAALIGQFRELNTQTKLFVDHLKAGTDGKSPFKPLDSAGKGKALNKSMFIDPWEEGDKAMKARDEAIKERARIDSEYWEKVADQGVETAAFWQKFEQDKRLKLINDEMALREKELDLRAQKQAEMDSNVATGIGLGGAALGGDASGFISMLGGIIGAAFGAPEIGAAIGAVAGPLLGALEPVAELFTRIALGAANLVDVGFSPLLRQLRPLGPALEMLLSSVGILLKSALQPLLPVFSLIVSGLATFIAGLASVIVVLSPFIELLTSGLTIFAGPLMKGLLSFSRGVSGVINTMVEASVKFYNGIIDFVRKVTGKKDFGSHLSKFDLMPGDGKHFDRDLYDKLKDNSDATKDNTKATRDLAREFRNLPAGYKINHTIYRSQDFDNAGGSNPYGLRNPGSGLHMPGPRDMLRGRL